MTVTFCGHRQLYEAEKVRAWLYAVTEQLIAEGAETFYLGGYGAFDEMAAAVLAEHKRAYPHIRRVLVLAYLNRGENKEGYDGTVYPRWRGYRGGWPLCGGTAGWWKWPTWWWHGWIIPGAARHKPCAMPAKRESVCFVPFLERKGTKRTFIKKCHGV